MPDEPVAVDDLNPELELCDLPVEFVELREAAAALYLRQETVVAPRIAAHLAVCNDAYGELSRYHAGVADRVDFDLRGYTRPAALWALSGRCLGLLRAVLVQVEAGVCCEALVTGRGLHEALQLLLVASLPPEEAILRKSLDDKGKHEYVTASQARKANQRLREPLTSGRQAGSDDVVPDMAAVADDLYDMLSRAGHNRREAVLDAVSVPLQRMTVGYDPRPAPTGRFIASWATTMTSEVVAFVGDALNPFIQLDFPSKVVGPMHQRIIDVRRSHPLDRAAVLKAVDDL